MHRNLLLFLSMCLTVAARAEDVTVLVRPGAPLNGPEVFPTIQNAVDHAPEPTHGGRVILRITPGVYNERVWIPQNRPRLTLLGLGNAPADTVITGAKFAKEQGGTFFTETVEVNGEGFQADNITFQNTAGPVGQALAISVLSDKAVFKHCRFLGYQDTLFANWGRQYYVDSYIEGAVDYIFGNATAVFDRVEVHSTAPGYITAQSRLRPDETTGYVFRDSRLTTAPGLEGKISLGRPWRPYSRVWYLNTAMDSGIAPGGFNLWRKGDDPSTMDYAEFGSTGAGAATASRAAFVRQMSAAQARSFSLRAFFQGWDAAADAARLP